MCVWGHVGCMCVCIIYSAVYRFCLSLHEYTCISVRVLGLRPRLCMHAYVFFSHMEMLRVWYSMPVCTSVTVHIDSVYAVCACVWRVCVCLRGLTGGLGLNLNAGHCAACRFRFCLSALFCAQDGNPSNMARIRIKSNSPPSLSLRSKTVSFEGTDGASGGLGRWSCKVPVPILWCVSEGLDWDCFVHSHRDKTDKGTGIIGLMLECVCGHQLLI